MNFTSVNEESENKTLGINVIKLRTTRRIAELVQNCSSYRSVLVCSVNTVIGKHAAKSKIKGHVGSDLDMCFVKHAQRISDSGY